MVRAGHGEHDVRMHSTDTGGVMTTETEGTLAPIAHGPGEGEHLWFFGG